MMNTKVNLIMPVKSGDMQIKETRSFSRSVKSNGILKPSISLENDGKLFSERLKEIALDGGVNSEDLGSKLREPDAGLNPVKPKYEKQGGVKNSPAHVSSERVTDKGLHQDNAVNSDIASGSSFSGVSDSGSANPDNGQFEGEFLNSLGYNVNITDEGAENLADVNNQSMLLQLQGVFASATNNVGGEQTDLNDAQNDNGETESVLGIDAENKTNTVKPSIVNSDVLTEGLKTKNTEDGNLPLQNGEKDKRADKKIEKNGEKVTDSIEKGKPIKAAALFKGTLEELMKQGEIIFGDIITFKVTDKGIFIGGEGDSTEDLSNLVDGDFLQKLFDVLSETLENVNQPTVSEQFRQLLITAIQKAVSNMHDPVKKEEEYQQKLVEFLMKFVDAINGKDDDKDKKVALEDDDSKDKGGLLLQLIENLIEAAKKNSDDDNDEYTAAIYVSAFEIGLLTPEQGFEESEETDVDSTAAVEQVSEVRTDSYSDGYQSKEPIHKTVENAVDVTGVNEERTVRLFEEIPQETAVYSEEKSVSAISKNESGFDAVNAVGEQGIAVNAADTYAVKTNAAETNVNVQKSENVSAESIQSVSFDSVYKAVQPANLDGNGSQSNADSGKKSTSAAISSANRYGRRVQNNSDEVEELKRLFGIKTSRDDKKLKEKNDILESTDEDGEETKTGVDENQGAVKAIGKDQEQEGLEGIDKSIIESVTLEAIKADNTAVAKAYTPDENGAKQIVTQIISEMLNNLSDGSRTERTVTTLTMTLNPESLGKVTMKISEEAGKISLLVTAHNKETAEILTQRMEAMQQAAKDNGTQLEKYQVVYGPEQESRAGQQNYDGSSKNPYVRQDNEETQKDEGGSQFAEFLRQAV